MNLEQKISEVSEKMDVYPMVNNASMYNYYRGKFDAYIDCRQLKQENEQLRAHVERLRLVAEMVSANRFLNYEFAYKVLKETPAQSLQQIKRDAVLEIASNIRTFETVYNDEICVALRLSDLESRANNLVKGGE